MPDVHSRNPLLREYAKHAQAYDRRWRRYNNAALAAVMEVLDLRGDERLLDLACGTGLLEPLIREPMPGVRVVGVDLSLPMLRVARARREGAFIQAGAEALPFPDGSFDAAVCASSLHYLPDPRLAVAELFRALRPGGRLVLLDWCGDFLSIRLLRAWLRLRGSAPVQTFGFDACQGLLAGEGFVGIRGDRLKIHWPYGLMRFGARKPADADATRGHVPGLKSEI